jgi:hypothetical protein
MGERIVARWREWSGDGIQHLELHGGPAGVVAEAVVVAEEAGHPFAARFKIACDGAWRTLRVEAGVVGDERRIDLVGDGDGRWTDGAGTPLAELGGAVDVDLALTPFTNTLPIRRLGLGDRGVGRDPGGYVELPAFALTTDPQRYTCLEPGRRYRYESLESGFVREIDIDGNGLVVTYPGLFRRVL